MTLSRIVQPAIPGLVWAALIGFLIRRYPWGQLGLDHFDEGIYSFVASRLARTGAIDPVLISYAPPVYPIILALGSWVTGNEPPSNLVSALMGSMTILAAGIIARRLFGDLAGFVTAWSVCCAGPHIAYCRMGLTDSTFLAAWMLGLLAIVWFVRNPTWISSICMGLFVGIAQQTKYNGWLLGASVFVHSFLYLVYPNHQDLRRFIRTMGYGTLGALTAALVVLPWYVFVEHHGGYGPLLQHQRSYLDPRQLWWPNLRSQVSQTLLMTTPFGLLSAGLLCLAWFLLRSMSIPSGSSISRPLRVVPTVILVGTLIHVPVLIGCLSVVGCRRKPDPGRQVLIASWLLTGILTPFYHPYSRLWLPFEAISWILLGELASRIMHLRTGRDFLAFDRTSPCSWLGLSCSLGFVVLLLQGPSIVRSGSEAPKLLASSNQMDLVTRQIQAHLPDPKPVLLTLIRPALGVRLHSRISTSNQPDVEQIRRSKDRSAWVLIDSTLINHSLTNSTQGVLSPVLEGRVLVAEFVCPLSLPTALDLSPRPGQEALPLQSCFWLYRPKNGG